MAESSESDWRSNIEAAVDDGALARKGDARRRFRQSLMVSVAVTVIWIVSVSVTGLWARVGEHWIAGLTMVFGSFVAGATPQGGGAVAFPVFTKALAVPTNTARSFSLCIQAVGMTCAALSIIINQRPVEWRAAAGGAAAGGLAFVTALLLLGDASQPFWPMDLPSDYVKVTFTLIVLAMGVVVVIGNRIPIREVSDRLPPLNGRLRSALIVAGLLGGFASALVGSGADVMIYIFVVILFGVSADVGVPTSVVTMASVSVIGFITLGLFDSQLFIDLDGNGMVAAVGGEQLAVPATQREADLFGMWLAAVPVVAWGAPFGAFVASKLSTAALVRLAVVLAASEVISTIIFLEPLRSDRPLQLYAVAGALLAVGGLAALAANRRRLFGLPDVSVSTLLTRNTTEVSTKYQDQLR